MADINKHEKAVSVYESLCATLDKRNWNYDRHDEDLVITFSSRGDDLPMNFVIIIDENRQLIRLSSPMPFVVPEEKRMEMAVAVCAATYGLVDGSFDFDISDGSISFRMTASFLSSEIGESLFDYFVMASGILVDKYNDKLFALSMGYVTLENFIANDK